MLDLYDTLMYSPLLAASEAIAASIGVDPTQYHQASNQIRYRAYAGEFGGTDGDMRATLTEAGVDFDDAMIRTAVAAEAAFARRESVLYDDTLEELRRLRAAGLQTQLITNASDMTRPVIEHLALPDYFDDIVVSSEVGQTKPGADIFRTALQRLDVSPEHCWFIDDKRSYLNGARAVGIRPIQIRRNQTADPDHSYEHGPVVYSLTAAVDLILA